MRERLHIRWLARFALAVLLLAALAPSLTRIAHALELQALPSMQLCTMVAPASPSEVPAAGAADCPMCLVAAQPALPPASPGCAAPLLALAHARPALTPAAPPLAWPWSAQLARAPPTRG